MRYPSLFLALCTCIFFGSCASSHKNMNYFSVSNPDSAKYYSQIVSHQITIQAGDKIYINVAALNPESAIPYNLPSTAVATSTSASGTQGSLYVVDSLGNILFPQLGLIKVLGLTTMQLRDTLLVKLKLYLKDPVVSVGFANFRVTVLGEVAKPGQIQVPDGNLNLLEALGLAGDMTMYGKRETVRVIRVRNGQREFGEINLLSKQAFLSPYFELKQNDIVYVETMANKPDADEQRRVRNITLVSSVIAVISTFGLLLLNIFK